MRKLQRDLVLILRTEAKNQRTPPIDYVIAEDGGRMVHRPEPDIAMAELLEEAAAALRTLLERNAALERERDKFEAKKISLQDDVIPGLIYRAEAAEARVTELEDLCNSLEAQAMGLAYDLKRAEDKLAEARKALGMMLKEHDILSGNFGDVMDPKHKRPDRWPAAAEAARRALEGGE